MKLLTQRAFGTAVALATVAGLAGPAGAVALVDYVLYSDGPIVLGHSATIQGANGSGGAQIGSGERIHVVNSLHMKGDMHSAGSVVMGHNALVEMDGNIFAGGAVEVIEDPDDVDLSAVNGAQIKGDIHVGGSANFGHNAHLFGNLTATGNVSFVNGATVDGDITAGGTLSQGSGATYNGTNTVLLGAANVDPDDPVLPTMIGATSFSSGGTNYNLGNTQSLDLDPGSYGNVSFGHDGDLNLGAGDYFFDQVSAVNNFNLNIDLDDGEKIRIFISDRFSAGHNFNLNSDAPWSSIRIEALSSSSGAFHVVTTAASSRRTAASRRATAPP